MGRYFGACPHCDTWDDLACRPGTDVPICPRCMYRGRRVPPVTKIPRPLPVCPVEWHRDNACDWVSREGLTICGLCHPPSHPNVVAERPDDLLTLHEEWIAAQKRAVR